MKIPRPDLESNLQQQCKEFNQALLDQAEEQYQHLQQNLMARRWEIVNGLEPGRPRRRRQRSTLATVLQSAITGASSWFIEKMLASLTEDALELPLPDGKEVIVLDAPYTVVTPNRKEQEHGITHSSNHNERHGTAHQAGSRKAPGQDRSDPGSDDVSD
jgi:hypothetical protein